MMSEMEEIKSDSPIIVREWSAEVFHQRVIELEAEGYVARRETYHITPEMSPETGKIIHLHSVEMVKPDSGPA
jgi:hypothetical protein